MTTALVTTKPGQLKKAFHSRGLSHYYPELPDYITYNEAHAILDAATPNIRDYLLFSILWNTGLRISEALSLTLNDVRDNSIRVKGKGGKIRIVPIKDRVLNNLYPYAIEKKIQYQDKLFPISRSHAHRLLNKYARQAGIHRPLHCHLLRHGFAVNFLKQVHNIVYLQELLGHSSIETTRIYTRAALPDVRAALEQVEM